MSINPAIDTILNHKSIRKYTDEMPPDEMVATIVKAAQRSAFIGQLSSILLCRDKDNHKFKAPLLFIFLLDLHRMELVMRKRGWELVSSDQAMLFFGIQDTSLMAQNLVIAAESLGLGTCYLGFIPFEAKRLKEKHDLPDRVFPVVGVAVGFPAEDPPCRPRYPRAFSFFEDTYPRFTDEQVNKAMTVMDDGYKKQGYYEKKKLMLDLMDGRDETHDYSTYSWTEHISRKWGQRLRDPEDLRKPLRCCGFNI